MSNPFILSLIFLAAAPLAHADGAIREIAPADKLTPIREVQKHYREMEGKKVTVRGKVIHSHGKYNAFVLDGDAILNDQILVVVDPRLVKNLTIEPNDVATVTGEIRALDQRKIRQMYRASLDPKIMVEWVGSLPALVTVSDAVEIERH